MLGNAKSAGQWVIGGQRKASLTTLALSTGRIDKFFKKIILRMLFTATLWDIANKEPPAVNGRFFVSTKASSFRGLRSFF